ncbi:uncharacterized protein [Macrobrachium rosenbergii]|uniref:uncharacterized protein n=1 Tax=Macrobrachium rosenbergii TaxID=79674 RepID=UPI0034D6BB3F
MTLPSVGHNRTALHRSIMSMKVILLVGLFAGASFAAPQVYEAGDVVHPKAAGNFGYLDSLVAETVNILPDITEVFDRITEDRSTDHTRVQEVMMEFMPLTRKVMKSTEKVDGKKFSRGQWDRFNAAEAVMPAVLTFMDSLRDMDFFGTGTTEGSS